MKRFIFLLFVLYFAVGMSAQTFTLTPNSSQNVMMDGKYYAVESESWSFNIVLVDSKLETISNCSLIVDGKSSPVTLELSEEKWSGSVDVSSLTVGEHIIKASITYDYHDTDSTTSVKSIDTPESIIVVYPLWNAVIEGPVELFVLDGSDEVSFSAITSGGYADGWRYKWYKNDNVIEAATGLSYKFKPTNDKGSAITDNYKLEIFNVIGETVVYQTDLIYTITIYPPLSYSFLPKKDLINLIDGGASEELSIIVEGGNPSGWTYQWYQGEKSISSTSSTFSLSPKNSTSSVIHDTYRVVATNKSDEGQVLGELEQVFHVDVYPALKYTIKPTEDPFNAIDGGESFDLSFVASGGNNNGWTYKWYYGNNSLSSTDTQISVSPNNSKTSVLHDTYHVVATNKTENGELLGELEHVFNVDIYPKVTYTTSDLDITVDNEDQVNLLVKMSGGFNEGWSFQWYDEKNNKISKATDNLYSFKASNNSTSILVQNYRLVYTNTINGKVLSTGSVTFTVRINPTVYATQGRNNFSVVSENEATMSFDVKGGDDKNWTYQWFIDTSKIPSATSKTLKVSHTNNTNEMMSYYYSVIISYVESGVEIYNTQFGYKVDVYPSLEINSISKENPVTCGGRDVTHEISTTGGNNDGWTYKWSKNGKAISGANKTAYSYVEENNTANSITNTYTVVATNKVGDDVLGEISKTFTVTVYGKPSAKQHRKDKNDSSFDAYCGQLVQLVTEKTGGYPSGWTYNWVTGEKSSEINYKVRESIPSNPSSDECYVLVENKYNGEVWYSETLSFDITAWEVPQIGTIKADTIDVYAGSDVSFTLPIHGGYDKGWSFNWTENGNAVHNSEKPTYSFVMSDTDKPNTYVERTYQVVAKNMIENTVGCDEKRSVTLRVWHLAEWGEDKIIAPANVRANTDFRIYINPIVGGYENDWTYRWSNSYGATFDQPVFITSASIGTGKYEEKATRDVTYRLTVYNYGPYSKIWDSKSYKETTVRVYNRPNTPTELVRKGNGTTYTMIVKSDLTDEQLQSREYYFVFGYTDSNGTDHTFEPTDKRYYKFGSNELYNNQNSYWVYAVWNYSDDVSVTSGRRFLDGTVDESYDASFFDGATRAGHENGEVVGLSSISANEIKFENHTVIAKFDIPTKGVISLISMNGQIVKQMNLETGTSFYKAVDLSDLSSGLYLVKCQFGDKEIVRKVIVK